MLAVRLHAVGDLRLQEVPVPDPGPGEVLIRVEAAGICGTDRHLFRGEFPSTPPVTLGHEFAGHVVGRGAGVTLPEGALVACDPNDWCGTCDACRRGRVNLCARNVATGIHRDGGFAGHAVFPAHKAVVLPDGLDPRHGAFCEPLACTLHGVDIGAPRAGERVLVIGGGVIGLLALQLAGLAGAETLLLTRNPSKRELALRLGASATAADAAGVRGIWPEGADLTLECAGVAETVAEAGALTRAGGRVVVLGVLPKGDGCRSSRSTSWCGRSSSTSPTSTRSPRPAPPASSPAAASRWSRSSRAASRWPRRSRRSATRRGRAR